MRHEQSVADHTRAFTPAVQDTSEWLVSCTRTLEMPRDAQGEADPDRGFDSLHVTHWPEELGSFERQISTWKKRLAPDAIVTLSVAHRYGFSRLREQLDLCRDANSPNPALSDREIEFSIPRITRALTCAGFVVEDVQRQRGSLPVTTIGPRSRSALIADGHMVAPSSLDYRSERLLVRARHAACVTGSVLIARRNESEIVGKSELDATLGRLRTFLPDSWEVVVGVAAPHESASWNDAFSRCSGERIWVLREGDLPTEAQFEALEVQVGSCFLIAEDSSQGLGGAMLDRNLVLHVGPFITRIESEIVAGEEWRTRAEALETSTRIVDVPGDWVGGSARRGRTDAREAEELLARWFGETATRSADEEGRESPPWVVENREPRISLCMIVRDEERFLGPCLERVRDSVDEIVIVDTGSRDRTVEIAESFGAKVIHRTWDDDFSAPRNLGIANATGDWILVLDADELVDEAAVPLLRKLAESERAAGFHLRFVNVHEQGETRGITMPRFFRRFDSLRYVNAIHEQVIESLQNEAVDRGLSIYPSDLRVVHQGYQEQVVRDRSKNERNLRIFEKELESSPDDPYCLYKFGDFLRSIEAPRARILSTLSKARAALLALSPEKLCSAPFACEVVALLALELAKDARYEQASKVVRHGLRHFPPTPNAYYVAAGIAQQRGEHNDAIDFFQRLIDIGDKSLVVPVQDGITSYIARTGIAVSLAALGRIERASEMLASVRRAYPEWQPVWLHSASVAMQLGDHETAIEFLQHSITNGGVDPTCGANEVAQSIASQTLAGRTAARLNEETSWITPVRDGFPVLAGADVPEGARR